MGEKSPLLKGTNTLMTAILPRNVGGSYTTCITSSLLVSDKKIAPTEYSHILRMVSIANFRTLNIMLFAVINAHCVLSNGGMVGVGLLVGVVVGGAANRVNAIGQFKNYRETRL